MNIDASMYIYICVCGEKYDVYAYVCIYACLYVCKLITTLSGIRSHLLGPLAVSISSFCGPCRWPSRILGPFRCSRPLHNAAQVPVEISLLPSNGPRRTLTLMSYCGRIIALFIMVVVVVKRSSMWSVMEKELEPMVWGIDPVVVKVVIAMLQLELKPLL